MNRVLLLLLVLSASLHAFAAEKGQAAFDAANKLYEQAKFSEAAAAYQAIIRGEGVSAPLYFNAGNAFFKSGQIGKAIYYYRLAEKEAPRDPDIRANLRFARDMVTGSATSIRPRAWLQFLSLNEWTGILAAAVWIWFALLAVRQWRPGLRQTLRGYTATAGIALGVLLLIVAFSAFQHFRDSQAIVIAREAVVRLGPLEESQSAFTARDGSELAILDQNGDWLQVRDSARHIGWIQRKSAIVFPPRG